MHRKSKDRDKYKKIKKIRKIRAKLRKELEREKQRLKKLEGFDITRVCNGKMCCQAMTEKGDPCKRPSMTQNPYYINMNLPFLCWQHAYALGVYFFVKISMLAYQNMLDGDSYCMIYPEECIRMLTDAEKVSAEYGGYLDYLQPIFDK